ncbi:hypothetical protein [Vibrio vulnificus]|uniref:hypothetical protein n=2 Tax=Vibrio TaxID=662 RepID=UPI001EFC2B5C|nr:hypothetical protein [Vibrio vulnificus]MCG8706605.1 hypothetical protein [Vibrio vulnificus]
MESSYKKYYAGVLMLNAFVLFLMVSTYFILSDMGWIDVIPYSWLPFLMIVFFVLARIFKKPFIKIDQTRFYKQFREGELIWVTHLASKDDMTQKINNKKLSPYGLKERNDCWFKIQTFLRYFGWADHKNPVTWVSAGAVIKGSGTKQGNPGKYSMGVVFQVERSKLKFPSGFAQSVYFGSLHMVIEDEITLDGEKHFYELQNGSWVEIHPIKTE